MRVFVKIFVSMSVMFQKIFYGRKTFVSVYVISGELYKPTGGTIFANLGGDNILIMSLNVL